MKHVKTMMAAVALSIAAAASPSALSAAEQQLNLKAIWLLMAGEGPTTSTPASTPPPVR